MNATDRIRAARIATGGKDAHVLPRIYERVGCDVPVAQLTPRAPPVACCSGLRGPATSRNIFKPLQCHQIIISQIPLRCLLVPRLDEIDSNPMPVSIVCLILLLLTVGYLLRLFNICGVPRVELFKSNAAISIMINVPFVERKK